MGIMDYIQNNVPFLNSREGDFIPLNKDSAEEDTLGPPVVLLYEVPETIDMEEFGDMVCDGMPCRTVVDGLTNNDNDDGRGESSVVIRRIDGLKGEELLDCSVQDALEKLVHSDHDTRKSPSIPTPPSSNIIVSSPPTTAEGPCPVLYFSGVTNKEMMDTYNIIANEIYQETNGVHWPACAKVVKPALEKTMRQVLEEISGDHADAMREGKKTDGGQEMQ